MPLVPLVWEDIDFLLDILEIVSPWSLQFSLRPLLFRRCSFCMCGVCDLMALSALLAFAFPSHSPRVAPGIPELLCGPWLTMEVG